MGLPEIGTQVVFQLPPERQTVDADKYMKYQGMGGILPEYIFSRVLNVLDQIEETGQSFPEKNSPHWYQAKGMADWLDLKGDTKRVYAAYGLLRSNEGGVLSFSEEDSQMNGGREAFHFQFDREVFAEALLMDGRSEDCLRLKQRSPGIFPSESV